MSMSFLSRRFGTSVVARAPSVRPMDATVTGQTEAPASELIGRDDDPDRIGPLLSRLRRAQGLTQRRVADRLCEASRRPTLTRNDVSRWEREERVPAQGDRGLRDDLGRSAERYHGTWRFPGTDHENGGGTTMIDLTQARWRKSSRSNGSGACVEVATDLPGMVAVRDSWDPDGPVVAVTLNEWRVFLAGLNCRF